MRFTQPWDDAVPNRQTLADIRVGTIPDHALDDLLLGAFSWCVTPSRTRSPTSAAG